MGALFLEIVFGIAALMIVVLFFSLAASCFFYLLAALMTAVAAPLHLLAWIFNHSASCSTSRRSH
jgi:hypothetical protein